MIHANEKVEFVDVLDREEKSNICRTVLEDLKPWFELPEANLEYSNGVKKYLFVEIMYGGEVVGFCSIKENNKYTAEIYVMGILLRFHRLGLGKRLLKYVKQRLKKSNFQYLEVKTLSETKESKEYENTRLFYEEVGFVPLETLECVWGKENPCLIMILKL